MKGHIWGEDTVHDDDLIAMAPNMYSVLCHVFNSSDVRDTLNTNGFVNGPTFSQEISSIVSNIKPRTKYNEYIRVTMLNGNYGSFCYKTHPTTPYWDCQDSSDYTYIAVVDDFGNLQQVGCATNIRGY
jgi:hypothetical protein